MLSFAGFLIFYSHMSAPMYILSYFSYLAYGFEGLVQAVYDNRATLDCPEDIIYCHYRTPDVLLDEIGIKKGNFWYDILMMAVNFIVLKIVGFVTLRKKLATG